jgi:hypothetical protein
MKRKTDDPQGRAPQNAAVAFPEEISMRTMLRFSPIFFLALAASVMQADLRGGEKKEKEKRVEDVVVNDAVTNADLKDTKKTDCYCKTYTFKMTKGTSYQIDMVHKEKGIDPYLRLEDPQGNQVAEDDDTGGFPDARITYRALKTGDYTIICTTFAGNTTGKFTLTVKQVGN